MTIFKLVMAEAREDDDLLLLVDKFIYPKRCPFLSLLSRALLALVGLGLETVSVSPLFVLEYIILRFFYLRFYSVTANSCSVSM